MKKTNKFNSIFQLLSVNHLKSYNDIIEIQCKFSISIPVILFLIYLNKNK